MTDSTDKPTVTIPQAEYDSLLEDSKILDLLRSHGVDNWNGWDYAMEEFNEENDD